MSNRDEDGSKTVWFMLVGAQRTGTNFLRYLLNSNSDIALLGEVFSLSPSPTCWFNFAKRLPHDSVPPMEFPETGRAVDRWLSFVEREIRTAWPDGDKSRCRAIGIDVKYNQLRWLAPVAWDLTQRPYLLFHFGLKGGRVIHLVRRNTISVVLSSMIAKQSGVWHNYGGANLIGPWRLDCEECIRNARAVVAETIAFRTLVADMEVVECAYEDVVAEVECADVNGRIRRRTGPLERVAEALHVDFDFTYTGKIQKVITRPYRKLIANFDELWEQLSCTEFSAMAAELE